MEIWDMKELDYLKPMETSAKKRDKSMYCQFHRDHGHDTEECIHLKEEIERQLKRGLLTKYVKNDRGKQKVDDRAPPRVRVIIVIAGGTAAGGDSNSDRKGYAHTIGVCSIQEKARFHQNITFNEKDLIGVAMPHDDALVIVGDIANFDVKKVLVDGGSAVNVLTWEAFMGLKISLEKLKAVSTPLQGFGGATVIPEGAIELPVTLGERREFSIGVNMRPEEKEELVKCFSDNLDVFAWSPIDIPEISPSVAQHRLGISSGAKPIRQKKRNLDPERHATTKGES
ncbi:uncharacterized protein LOC111385183 [Olea europaea var. sylvestris]|uniref:uncharacterized protein LOC111385183 n=1 Tax=Olea europaea var. sylvestris TaxID=158386 RepID=UPI000C1D1913|nr:uncharacterized protein LOC111385183 [Olea europaea var. sylvestris]